MTNGPPALRHGPRLRGVPADVAAWAALAGLIIVAGALLFHLTRGTTLWFDEWQWVLHRRANGIDDYLSPHNGHLSVVPVALYKLLFVTAGIEDSAPYRALVLAAHQTCVALVFVYAKRRVGGYFAVLAAALLVVLGPAWQNILWPFQIGYLISLASAVGALLMLDRSDRAGDAGAAVLVGLSLASSGLGVPLVLGVVVELLYGRRRWRDLWIVAAPLALYGAWWLNYQDIHRYGEYAKAPKFAADALAAALSALAGLAGRNVLNARDDLLRWGRPLEVVAAAFVVWRLIRLRTVPPRVAALLVIVGSFWVLTEVSRGTYSSPFEGRYLYVGGLFLVLLAVELGAGLTASLAVKALVGLLVAAALVSNALIMRDGARYLRAEGEITRADLGAVQLARGDVTPGYTLVGIPGSPFVTVNADDYFKAERAWGTPAFGEARIATAAAAARAIADAELVRIERVALDPNAVDARPGGRPMVDPAPAGSVARRGACVASSGPVALTVPAAGLRIGALGGPVQVGVRRFGDRFLPIGTVTPVNWAVLRIPPDRGRVPWHASFTPAGGVSVCGLRP